MLWGTELDAGIEFDLLCDVPRPQSVAGGGSREAMEEGLSEHEYELWADLISHEVGSWHPTRLPASFQPSRRASARRSRLPLQVAVAAACLALLVAAGLTAMPRGLQDVIINLGSLGSPHPAGTPQVSPPTGAARPPHRGVAPGGGPAGGGLQATSVPTQLPSSGPRTGAPTNPPSPVSGPRQTVPAPSLPGVPGLPAPSPSLPLPPLPSVLPPSALPTLPPLPTVAPLLTPPLLATPPSLP